MRLYYMTEQIWAEKILRERRLKLSTIDEANDPFELMGAAVRDPTARHAHRVLHANWTQTIGMVCLSRSWDSPVMWAHYGHKHRGVCLGFDVTGAEVHKVNYRRERLSGVLDDIGRAKRLEEHQLRTVLTTKFKDWEYEREWRIFADLAKRQPVDSKYYLNLEPHFTLREVILGVRCPTTAKEFAHQIESGNARVDVIRARPAFRSFRMVRQLQEPIASVLPRAR